MRQRSIAVLGTIFTGLLFLLTIAMATTATFAQGVNPPGCTMTPDAANNAIKNASASPPQAITVPTTAFVPAGAPATVAVKRAHNAGEVWQIFGRLDSDAAANPRPSPEYTVNAAAIPESHPLVTNGRMTKTATLITFYVPPELWSLWSGGSFYLFNCKDAKSPAEYIS